MKPSVIFDALYADTDDPWGFRTRWYEKRKRAVLLSVLPHEFYRTGWEMACSNGELAAALAERCGDLLASDGHGAAVAAAERLLTGHKGVRVEQRSIPEDWPNEAFDLVVFSEVGYYLTESALRETSQRLQTTLSSAGVLVACHWRMPIEHCDLTGDGVHRILSEEIDWRKAVRHLEDDFILEVWSREPMSVAAREGLA